MRCDLAAHRLRLRRDGQEFVHRAAFVGLEMREGEVAQAAHRQHGFDRGARRFEDAAQAGVEEQRLVVDDQILVEREAAGNVDGA